MRVIWKFPLLLGGKGWQLVPIAHDAKIVLVDIDPASGQPAIWAEHSPVEHPIEEVRGEPASRSIAAEGRHFGIFPTGGPIAQNAVHVGSTIDHGGYVWHVYERTDG